MRVVPVMLCLVGGCGRIDFAAIGSTDTGSDDAGGPDSMFDMPGTQSTYFKASNTNADDKFGNAVALSADGSTLVIGARGEDGGATTIDGDQADNTAVDAGAVYVFVRTGDVWTQQAYLKAFNAEAGDLFGNSVAVSAAGDVIAVGASAEDSASAASPGDNSIQDSGAIYVFRRSGVTWSQEAYLKAGNPGPYDNFGIALSISADGNVFVASATGEDGGSPGVNGPYNDNTPESGAAYVFARTAGWAQQAYLKASIPGTANLFADSVAISGDGSTIAIGSDGDNSGATGINGDQADVSQLGAGAAYMFRGIGGVWSQEAYVKASNTASFDRFGAAIALSGDGNVLAVGAFAEDSGATGIDGNQADNSVTDSGAIYMFERAGTQWSQQAYVKASNPDPDDGFGISLSLSASGNVLASGAVRESSASRGANGDQTDNSKQFSGAAYVFTRHQTWSQILYLKATNTDTSDFFGVSIALSPDGSALVAGATPEASAATGIGGDGANNAMPYAGAAYLYR